MSAPVESDGRWSARFVIPAYDEGAATRGAAPVTPGRWLFEVPRLCEIGPSSRPDLLKVPFEVSSTAFLPDRFQAIAATPDGHGYWLAQASGGVYSFGGAHFYGSLPGIGVEPAGPVVGMAATPDGKGYWLVSAGGGVYVFGDAGFYGSAA